MNYFIDFDHTLYNTPLLTRDMLSALSAYISKNCNQNYDEVLNIVSSKFKRGKNNIYDIYDLIAYFARTEFCYDETEATDIINKVISSGKKYLFEDSVPFLQYLKSQGHKSYILSYNETEVYFQTVKIAGSGVLKFVNGVISTTTLKGEMPLDFSKCIFIDDKPKDLISIYQHIPFKAFRIRRPNDTYSNIETNLPILEFESLEKLQKHLQMEKAKILNDRY